MDQAEADGVRRGPLGPWRRWRSWTPRERVALASTWLVGGIAGGLGSLLVSPVLGERQGVGGAGFFGVWMVVIVATCRS
jgi:hypothetical protein